MKFRIVTLLFLALPILLHGQTSLSPTTLEGMWQVVAVDIPTFFSYDSRTDVFTPYELLGKDVKAELVDDTKKTMKRGMGMMYLELKPSNGFTINFTDKPDKGSYSIISKTAAPSPADDEELFVRYINTYGYENGIKLDLGYNGNIYANGKSTNDGMTLTIHNLKINLSNFKTACSYTLMKATTAESDAVKAKEQKAIEDENNKLKAKATEKEKQDELKDGKLYTTADKEPYLENETALIQKIKLGIGGFILENGLPGGAYAITSFFTVNKDGTIADIEIQGNHDELIKKELKRLISKLPIITPAEVGGQKVRFRLKKEFKLTIADE